MTKPVRRLIVYEKDTFTIMTLNRAVICATHNMETFRAFKLKVYCSPMLRVTMPNVAPHILACIRGVLTRTDQTSIQAVVSSAIDYRSLKVTIFTHYQGFGGRPLSG